MKTLVTDDFAERPVQPSFTMSSGATSSASGNWVSMIVTTGGYVPEPEREPYRTQAFVDKRPEIEGGKT